MTRSEVTISKSMAAIISLLSIGLAGVWGVEAGDGTSQVDLRKPFIGTWRLVSIEGGAPNTNRRSKPTGLIIYDTHGYMAAQIMPDRQRPKWTGTPTPEVALEAMRGYTAYFGTYTIDEKAMTGTHHRQGMLDEGDTEFVRKFEFGQAIASSSRRLAAPGLRRT